MADALVLGIDPGVHTGLAHYVEGRLVRLETIAPHEIDRTLRALMPAHVVFEDSRLQSHVWSRGANAAASAKMARNVGQIDAWCALIAAVCAELGIPARGVSPAGKGAKVQATLFERITGWAGASNEHTRDAAMVAWPHRGAQRSLA